MSHYTFKPEVLTDLATPYRAGFRQAHQDIRGDNPAYAVDSAAPGSYQIRISYENGLRDGAELRMAESAIAECEAADCGLAASLLGKRRDKLMAAGYPYGVPA